MRSNLKDIRSTLRAIRSQSNAPIIFLNTKNPSAEHIVGNMKPLNKVASLEHSDGGPTGVLIAKVKINESKTVKIELLGRGNGISRELKGVLITRGSVVAQTLKGDLLFGHQLARRFVHLGIVDPQSAKNREGLEYRDVAISKRASVVLKTSRTKLR